MSTTNFIILLALGAAFFIAAAICEGRSRRDDSEPLMWAAAACYSVSLIFFIWSFIRTVVS